LLRRAQPEVAEVRRMAKESGASATMLMHRPRRGGEVRINLLP
jgi:hypothetical protein